MAGSTVNKTLNTTEGYTGTDHTADADGVPTSNLVSADDDASSIAQDNSTGTIIFGGSPAATGW